MSRRIARLGVVVVSAAIWVGVGLSVHAFFFQS
jgi:hypothetical protein